MKIRKFYENEKYWTFEQFDAVARIENEIIKLRRVLKDNLKSNIPIAEVSNKINNLQQKAESQIKIIDPFLSSYIISHSTLVESPHGGEVSFEYPIKIYKLQVVDKNDIFFKNYLTSPDEYLQVIFCPYDNCDDNELMSAWFTKKDIEDFLIFMRDPEIYNNIKKYNL